MLACALYHLRVFYESTMFHLLLCSVCFLPIYCMSPIVIFSRKKTCWTDIENTSLNSGRYDLKLQCMNHCSVIGSRVWSCFQLPSECLCLDDDGPFHQDLKEFNFMWERAGDVGERVCDIFNVWVMGFELFLMFKCYRKGGFHLQHFLVWEAVYLQKAYLVFLPDALHGWFMLYFLFFYLNMFLT